MIRRIACVFIVVIIWLAVFGWAAHVRCDMPLLPRQQLDLNANAFRVVMGAGSQDGTALRVGAVGDDGSALQMMPVSQLRAEDYSVLRYRFDGFPRTLELSFVFRRAGEDDVQTATIPWPGNGWHSIGLDKVPGWRGEISELGFAEYATPQIVPESSAFRPFRFDRAELWGPSWRGSFAALYTSWFGYTPWALLSISALGPQREVAQAAPLLPFVVFAAALSLLATATLLRWRRARFVHGSACTALLLWVFFDIAWLNDLHGKHQLTETIYAGKSWAERQVLVPDQDVQRAAEQVRNYFAQQPPHPLLVAADTKFVFLRLIYQMLPLNAAPLEQALGVRWPRRDTRFVLYQSGAWRYDESRHALVGAAHAFAVEPVFEQGDLHIYKFTGAP